MLQEADLARIQVSVREQQLRQRWRIVLLWSLRICSLVLLLMMLRSVLIWPFRDLDPALDACMAREGAQARDCMRQEIELRRLPVERARREVLALTGLVALTLVMALMVRFGLRRQMQQQSRFADQVFDAVPLPMSLRSPRGIFLRVNAAFEQRHGRRNQDLAGRHHSELFPEAVIREVERLDALAIASTEPVEHEFEEGSGDDRRAAILRLRAVRDEDGAVLALVMVRSDITELRGHQRELTESNERLRLLSARMVDAQEAERRRIARDLHDQVGQILTALKLQLGMVAQQGAPGGLPAALQPAREFAEEALRHTRDLSASLHPHLLDDLGLEAAVSGLVERFVRPLVAQVDLDCRIEPPRATPALELVAFRVVQEALTNAVRHAQARRIGIVLRTEGGRLVVEVGDDGAGFQVDEASAPKRATSLGLAGMHDRVAELGGELAIDSAPAAGTRLRAQLPWSAAA